MKREYMPILGTSIAVRMDKLNEEWAMLNHGQTLDRLAERGGLSWQEAAALLLGQRIDQKMPKLEAISYFMPARSF